MKITTTVGSNTELGSVQAQPLLEEQKSLLPNLSQLIPCRTQFPTATQLILLKHAYFEYDYGLWYHFKYGLLKNRFRIRLIMS